MKADTARLRVWIEAAALAIRRQQRTATNKLLLIAFDVAIEAGRPDVAGELQAVLVRLAPSHRIAANDVHEAVGDASLQGIIAAARREVAFEEAEGWVQSIPLDDRVLAEADSLQPGDRWLTDSVWRRTLS